MAESYGPRRKGCNEHSDHKIQDTQNMDERKHCPICGPTDVGVMEDDGWYTWYVLSQRLDIIFINGSQLSRYCVKKFRPSMETTSKKIIQVENNDLANFRHIVVEFDLAQARRCQYTVSRCARSEAFHSHYFLSSAPTRRIVPLS